ncbi:hypothetical protein ID866_9980 [Astraeus odoratus]|nr:hypothetical protein ID866_9980 [Astraeus odoratus]
MKFAAASFLLASVTAVLGQDTLTINSPTTPVYYDQPYLITWNGGVGPYDLGYVLYLVGGTTAIPGNEFFATGLPGYSYNWTVSVDYYTPIALVVQDSTGTLAETTVFTVERG